MDAVALDDLDLDGMFADDGDMLFEGLDIGLDDTMGDMISTENTKAEPAPLNPVEEPPAAPPAPAPAPKTKRSGGPRTKRSNPMLEKPDSVKEETTTAGATSKRRKTKRKSKAPAAFGEDEDETAVELQPPKKKRKATTKTKKAEPVVVATTKTKRKKKNNEIPVASTLKSSGGVPGASGVAKIASTKSSILPTSSAAASGQVGGRPKKAGTAKVKRKLKKSTSDGTSENTASHPPVLLKPPKPEPTFGGLHPSNTLFYPFLESVSAESTMQKRKTYPVMDRLSSTLASQLLSYAPKPSDVKSLGITEDSAIFKLMLDTYEGNDKDKKNFTAEKRTYLLRAIHHLRKMIDVVDKNTVVKDVFAMCGLLTREYNFLKQTLENMKVWCKNEFDLDKYKETYEPRIEQPKITKWKSTTGIVRVKIACTGYKTTKASPPLFAMLPALVFDSSSAKGFSSSGAPVTSKASAANDSKKGAAVPTATASSPKTATATATLTKKKRKEKAADKSKTKIAQASSAVSSTPVPKTYADSAPQARHQQIIERVSQLAMELESSVSKEKVVGKLNSVPEEQPPLHTTRMWEWVQSAGFYNKAPSSSKLLASIKSPKLHVRGPFNFAPKTIQGHEADGEEGGHRRASPASLFDRLQSLLVEEDSDDDDTDRNEVEDSDEDSLGFLDDDDDDDEGILEGFEPKDPKNGAAAARGGHPDLDVADLSELSIEERTFVHLCQAGLIKKSLYPSVDLVISRGEIPGNEADDFGDVIGAISTDLTRITSMSNARVAYLERMTSDADAYYRKQADDEEAVLIAKCQNLMKRTKEKAKKAKQKKDETLNLPW